MAKDTLHSSLDGVDLTVLESDAVPKQKFVAVRHNGNLWTLSGHSVGQALSRDWVTGGRKRVAP